MTNPTPSQGVLDCDLAVGRPSAPATRRGCEVTGSSLLGELRRLGIAGGFAHHVLAREWSPARGNEAVLEALAGIEEVHPCWAILPATTGEIPPADELVARMRTHGVRLAKAFPGSGLDSHRYTLARWCTGDVLDALAEAGTPLVVDFGIFRRGEPPWRDVFELCTDFPSLNVILAEVQGRNNRTLYALLDRIDNLVLSSGGINVHRGIEDIVARFGSHRIVYGSGYPRRPLGGALFQLQHAEISDDDRRRIGGDNLVGLTAPVEAVTSRAH